MADATTTGRPFDAVLIVAFGGPAGERDIRPFLANVVRGRAVDPDRLEAAVRRYESIGGVSPITAITRRQAAGLEHRLRSGGLDLPVHVGMRNWHPFVADTLRTMAEAGVRRAIGFIASAFHSFASCTQYKRDVQAARRTLREAGLSDVEVFYVDSWYAHDGFIAAQTGCLQRALARLEEPLRSRARVVFTAHSIPVAMAARCRYREQLAEAAGRVARRADRADWTIVYQSRSGRSADPWLGPDIGEYLQAERSKGLSAAVIVPIGFLTDHIEVSYDLDRQVADLCERIGLTMVRAPVVNDDPVFLDMMVDVVRQTWTRYRRFAPLPITADAAGGSEHVSPG